MRNGFGGITEDVLFSGIQGFSFPQSLVSDQKHEIIQELDADRLYI